MLAVLRVLSSTFRLPRGLFAHVISGSLVIGGHRLHTGQVGWSDPAPGTRKERDTSMSLHLAALDVHQPAIGTFMVGLL